MNGDYIELTGADSEAGIVDRLTELLTPLAVREGKAGFLVIHLAEYCFAYLDFDPGGPWSAMLVIGHLADDDPTRRSVAETTYRTLATHTPWSLRWSSDCTMEVVTTATVSTGS